MVQEFLVVRCFTCQSFQVQQVKKVTRWTCKLCGEKQSLLKEFGRGSGADCRRHVQKLNAMRGVMMEKQEHDTWSLWKQAEADGQEVPEEEGQSQVGQPQVSCWSKYLDTPEEAEPKEEEDENVLMDRQHFHSNNMIDRKRKRVKGWTDGGLDMWTPEQSNWSSLKPVRPSATTTRTSSLNQTRTSSLSHTRTSSLNQTRTSSLSHTRTSSLNQTRTSSLNQTRTSSLSDTRTSSLNQTRTSSLSDTRTSSLNQTRTSSLSHTSPPNKKSLGPPSVGTGPVSRWALFLSSDCQVEEEPSINGCG